MSDRSVLKFNLEFSFHRVFTDNKFKWDKGDYNNFRDFLDINWDDTLDMTNATVDEMWDKFKTIMLDGMNIFIPRGTQHPKRTKKNYQPFTAELKQLINKKHRLWKRWITSLDETVFDKHKNIRNKVKSLQLYMLRKNNRKYPWNVKEILKSFGIILIEKQPPKLEFGICSGRILMEVWFLQIMIGTRRQPYCSFFPLYILLSQMMNLTGCLI